MIKLSDRAIQRKFWNNVHPGFSKDDCWHWMGSTNALGYGRVRRNGKVIYAHRMSLIYKTGDKIQKDICVCHHCDNPLCVRPDHLFLGTKTENNIDRHAKGRSFNTKLNKSSVIRIRKLYSFGQFTMEQLAVKFDTSPTHVCGIVNRHRWNHV